MNHRLPAILIAALAVPALAAPHGGSAFIQDYDSDHDGKVTRAEFDSVRVARFRATDGNGDGWVSDAEYSAEYQGRLDAQLAASTEPAERKAEERERQLRQTHIRFAIIDRDKDGKMQQAEYDASGARAYADQDDDKDGIVTQADAAATRAKMLAAREAQAGK